MNRFDAKTKHIIQWFTAKLDMNISDFQLQEDEVEEVRWWTKEELQNKLTEAPELFLKPLPRYLEMFADL
jgi:isopentenyldiphosphate isomerase